MRVNIRTKNDLQYTAEIADAELHLFEESVAQERSVTFNEPWGNRKTILLPPGVIAAVEYEDA